MPKNKWFLQFRSIFRSKHSSPSFQAERGIVFQRSSQPVTTLVNDLSDGVRLPQLMDLTSVWVSSLSVKGRNLLSTRVSGAQLSQFVGLPDSPLRS